MSVEQRLYELCTELQSISGKNDKIAFIKKHKDDKDFTLYLDYLLDKLKVYGIQTKKLDKAMKNAKPLDNLRMNILNIFEYLLENNTGKDDDAEYVASYILKLPEHLQDWASASIAKTLKLGVTAKSVNKALGYNLIVEFQVQRGKSYSDEAHKFKNEDKIITEKFDGCFTAETRVNMADGTMKKIKDVQIGDSVLSFNEYTKEVSSKKVVNTFYNGKKPKEQWLKLLFNKTFGRAITGTKEHKVFTPVGWKKIEELNIGDSVYAYNYIFTDMQKQIILGSGLGDSAILKDNKDLNPIRMRLSHGEKQKEYNEKLAMGLKDFTGVSKIKVSGYGGIMHEQNIKTMDSLPRYLYDNSNIDKTSYTFTKDILENIEPLALAIYYMDDGSLKQCQKDGHNVKNVNPTVYFSTHRHSTESIDNFMRFLDMKYNIESYKSESKTLEDGSKSYIVTLSVDGTSKLFDLIAPYIPEEMRYKLSKKWHDVDIIEWWNTCGEIGLAEHIITGIQTHEEMNRAYNMMDAYDLEIEDNHTYFVENLAVHNCRGICVITNGTPLFKSRQNKPFNGLPNSGLDDLVKAMTGYPDGYYEGELIVKDRHLYDGRQVLQETKKILGSDEPNKKLDWILFDYVTHEEFAEPETSRGYFQRKEDMYNMDLENKDIQIAKTIYKGKDDEIIYKILDTVVERGGEGLMANLDRPYKKDKTNHILKIKKKYTSDLRVIGFEEGKSTGKHKGTLGAFVLEYKGNTVNCGIMPDEVRHKVWSNQSEYLNTIIEVEHEAESWAENSDVPSISYPVFVDFRPEKTEPSYAHGED